MSNSKTDLRAGKAHLSLADVNPLTRRISFLNNVDQAIVGLSSFRMVVEDFFEGKHIQIRELGVEVEFERLTKPLPGYGVTFELTPKFSMRNSSEGGFLLPTDTHLDAVLLARKEGSENLNLTSIKVSGGQEDVSIGQPIETAACFMANFHTRFDKDDHELERSFAMSSLLAGDTNVAVSGESQIIGKKVAQGHPDFALSNREVEAGILTAAVPEAGFEIVELNGLKHDQEFLIEGSKRFSEVYALIRDFDVWLEGGKHKEIGIIEIDVEAKQRAGEDFHITPIVRFEGSDHWDVKADPGSNVSVTLVGILD